MPGPTLTVAELAAEIGRSESWVYEHHREEAAAGRLPPALHGGRAPLTWSRAQLYAVQDKSLPPPVRLAAQAWRAAVDAARESKAGAAGRLDDDHWRAVLDGRLARQPKP